MKNLSDILPLYGVEHDMLLSKAGDITIAYRLELPEIFTLSTPEYELLHQTWMKAIKLLPVKTVLHKQDWYLTRSFVGDFQREHSFLSRSSERFFHERAFLEHSCYLMLTLRSSSHRKVNSLFSSLIRGHLVPPETLDPAFAKSFESSCAQFVKVLADSGLIQVRRLEQEELVHLVNQYLLLNQDGVKRDLSFDNGICIGEYYCDMFTLSDSTVLPALCGSRMDYEKYGTDGIRFPIGFASPTGLLLSCNHLYNQFLLLEDTTVVNSELERKQRRLQALSAYSRENGYAKEAVAQYLNECIAESNQPVFAHFHVLAWTEDTAKVPAIRNACTAAISQMDGIARIETVGAPQLYWAGIPGNAGDLPVNETFLTFSGQACCFLHLETNYRSSLSPFGLRFGDRITGIPVHVDLSDEPMHRGVITNRNKIVIGPSGSGKSFFTNHLVHSYHAQAAHVVIVDVGHSYKSVCELVGGYYFTYSENNPIRFNPFYVPGSEVPDIEKRESIKALLVTLWKKDQESFSRSEYVALSNALQAYYEQEVGFRSFNSFYEFVRDQFTVQLAAEKVRTNDFDVAGFLYVLKPFYKGGEFDYLLNATENLDLLHQPFIVFELDTIKDHPILFPVVTIVIMEVFIAKMRGLKGLRKIMLIEEAWKAITKNGMAEYIKYLFKTARKHFGEAIVVTQEIEDILSSEIIKQAIVNNADCKILLDQSKYQNRFEEIQQLLGLTEKERALVLSMNRANDPQRKYKEVFVSLGGRISKVYRLEVSPEEYLAYTTEETEKLKVSKAAETYGSMEAAIQSIVQENQ
ncbi:MAG: TraG family conjugative transposon ATPase [Bacteroidetes bacterium]|nr:TraG family conjugative transposon ATPase [Bacteroidota bacterium]